MPQYEESIVIDKPFKKRRIAQRIAFTVLALLLLGVIAARLVSKPRPVGTSGPEAETLAESLLKSVRADAWKRTGAVRFGCLNHYHLWDRLRGFDRIESGPEVVLLRTSKKTGRVWRSG